MLHNASLIHDDVVDETKLRRGVPTINNTWDNHIAVLVGDFFVSTALSVGIHTGRISVLGALSELGKELSLGEIDQICNAQERHLNETAYLSVIRKKTASLFMKCVQLGAETGDARPEEIAPMVDYAELLGLCFQIKDDIFDFSDIEDLGKPTMNDIRDGKATLPIIKSLQRASEEEAEHIKELAESLANKLPHIDVFEAEQDIRSFVLRYDGIRYAYQQMEKYRKKAIEALSVFPDNKYKESLLALLDYAINRMK
jgi:octaprenyl-diphosphate synthase